jgi:hypothetical protein
VANTPSTRRGGARLSLRAVASVAPADASNPKKPRTFRIVANTGEPMRIWPFEFPVVVDLDTIDVSGLPVPALYDHCPDTDFVVGNVLAAGVEAGQLVASGPFTIDENIPADRNYARKVLNKADAGFVWQASIGGDPATTEEVKAGVSVQVNGRTYQGPVIVARGVQLREISFVVLGGDRRTSAVVARHSIKGKSPMTPTFEQYCASKGFAVETLDDTQRANLELDYASAYPDGGTDVTAEDAPTDDEIAGMETEEEVTAAIEEAEELPPTNAAAVLPKLRARLREVKRTARRQARLAARTGQRTGQRPAPRQPIAAGGTQPNAIQAERARVAAITQLCAEHGDPKVKAADGSRQSLSVVATQSGWTVERVQSELLANRRADRPKGPTVLTPPAMSQSDRIAAMSAALILRASSKSKIGLDHKAFTNSQAAIAMGLPAWLRAPINADARQRIMEAAHQIGQMHAMDMARECARLDGKSFSAYNREAILQAAFSGMSLTNSFTTNINALMLATYFDAPDTTQGWVQEQEVGDFRTNERPRMVKSAGLQPLPKGGTADDMTRTDAGESYKIARYAGKITVDEQDMINDTLGALSDLPVEMGNAGARLRPDLVYSILINNPTLTTTGRAVFNSTDANTASGAALAAATLRSACSAMMAVRENSVNLNLMPTHLIVPTELFFLGNELVQSVTIVIAGTAGSVTERGVKNVLSDLNMVVVSDGRLQNGLVDPTSGTTLSGSTSTWYLASNFAHTIEVGYLRGTGRAPRVRPYKLDKGQYGAGWDVSMDIGAKSLDWKGLQRRQS